ncbi:MAG: terminase TerL endonuclease subunit [Leuconostoc pseudomesenteroides]|uniref:terminase large subunit n=1 Tax=Leuconostoc pseudomesenteroides TaxID=33968 RepID=UPI001E28C612|nr:terminase TerL endonuclease subunit [Leuconostoc pseudomesenteroides]MCC7668933.1 terminase large subunit [Leuconostoc pseudomesenteroides]
MSGTKISIIDESYARQETWWKEFVDRYRDWYYLTKPSKMLLTNYYAELIRDGEVPASKMIKLAVERHFRDMERQGTDDFPWVFDEEAAWRPIRFIEENIKSSTDGSGKNIVMQPFQHFIIGSLYGWVHKETKLRRFVEGLEFLGRKNGKTTQISGLAAYMAGYDHEQGAQVYALANRADQSRLLFEETGKMIKASPFLSDRFVTKKAEILFPKTNSKIKALSAEKSGKDGYNTHMAVFDEIHEYKDYSLINVMRNSMGMRDQPMTIYITTAGYELNGPLVEMVATAKNVLTHYENHENERTFYYLASMDSEEEIDDPELWIKANPNFPMMQGLKMLGDWKKSRRVPGERLDWITKVFNLFSEASELSFLDNETILDNAENHIDVDDLKLLRPVAGFDLSETEDFTAVTLEFPLADGRIYLLSHSFIPQSKYDKDIDRQPTYRKWESEDDLTIIPGKIVDYEYILNYIKEKDKEYRIRQVNYDPAKAIFLTSALEQEGFKMEVVRQGFTTLGGPTQNFKELMIANKVVFNNNSMLKWYMSNATLVRDRNDNFMITKSNHNRKIDGLAAALNAHVTIAPELAKKKSGGFIKTISWDDL